MVVVYRPPPFKKNRLNVSLFLDEFSTFLEKVITTTKPLTIVGDFNFHLDDVNQKAAVRFQELLDVFNLKQHVRDPTYKNGHTLDLVITRADEEPVGNVRVSEPAISDHCAIHFDTSHLVKPRFERQKVTYRKLRSVDKGLFTQDIKNSALMNHELTDVSALVDCYNKTLLSLLNEHAPVKSCIVTISPAAPWYSENIKLEKAKRRKLERKWRKDKLVVHSEMYVEQCVLVNKLIHDTKMRF